MATGSVNFGAGDLEYSEKLKGLRNSEGEEFSNVRKVEDSDMGDVYQLEDKKHKHMYIVVDTSSDPEKLTNMRDFKVVVEPNTEDEDTVKKRTVCCSLQNVCKWLIVFMSVVAISIATSFVTDKYIRPYWKTDAREITQQNPDKPQAAKLTREVTEETPLATRDFNWGTFQLDDKNLREGMDRLPWRTDEDGGTGITVTNSSCFIIPKTSVYEFYSKITFEFTRENTVNNIYHIVQRDRNGKLYILEKNIVSAPYRSPDSYRRLFQTSDIIVLGKFEADDKICVEIQDTSLVYASPIDNSVKVIQKG